MGKPRKTGKRTDKSGKLFFCPRCFYYYGSKLRRSMWNPSPSVQAVNRTCNACRKRGHSPK